MRKITKCIALACLVLTRTLPPLLAQTANDSID